MDISLFIRGLVIGFSIAAPVGPIGVLCIRRTLANGRLSGFLSGLGAATADACYGSVAALGLTFISTILIEQQIWLRLVGGVFLCYLGLRTFFERPAGSVSSLPLAPPAGDFELGTIQDASPPSARALMADYASTFLLTLTNPLTILSFAAIFAGLGVWDTGGSAASAMLLVLGVFCGSASWWLVLSTAADVLRVRFLKPQSLVWVNRISGLIIGGFGLAALVSVVPFFLHLSAD
jgi:threonine/homoserine/homoserine lactone efflux protein